VLKRMRNVLVCPARKRRLRTNGDGERWREKHELSNLGLPGKVTVKPVYDCVCLLCYT